MKVEHKKYRVVVVGGGFAGLNLVKSLSGNKNFLVTVVDKNNYHFFPPLLYQVASAFIEPSNISYPFRRLFQKRDNVRFHMGELEYLCPETSEIITTTGKLVYDYLVLCMGTETNFFGLDNVRRHALPMKNINDALQLRNQILLSMEQAVRATSRAEKARLLNIVVAGGGPSGVEISGMLAELGRYIAAKEYPEIRNLRGHIHLVDASGSLLGTMSSTAGREAQRVLTKLGVQIKLNVAVKDYADGKVLLSDGSTIPANVLIWTSGVIAKPVPGIDTEALGRGGRLKADEYNRVYGYENIFSLGDMCIQRTDPQFPNGHPQLAQVAIQQGRLLAKNLEKMREGKSLKTFRYKDKGSMAIISKYKAVADLPGFSITGFFAWLTWLFIHIIPLVGFRNKAKIAFNWFWSFITNDPTLRLIIRPGKIKSSAVEEEESRQ